ncbi:MAG: hypothetical protein QNJ17_09980, partial [Desulfocapsaceae bacterium]|nr:hypothetical protein [Desulfocapsaceae bacterium]
EPLAKVRFSFKIEACEKIYHRHIMDISESHSVRLPADKILSITKSLDEKIVLQAAQHNIRY